MAVTGKLQAAMVSFGCALLFAFAVGLARGVTGHDTVIGPKNEPEPDGPAKGSVIVLADLTEVSQWANTTMENPIEFKTKIVHPVESFEPKVSSVAVVPRAKPSEPFGLLAKVPPGKSLEVHAILAPKKHVRLITEVDSDVSDVAVIVRRGRAYRPWTSVSPSTREMFNVDY